MDMIAAFAILLIIVLLQFWCFRTVNRHEVFILSQDWYNQNQFFLKSVRFNNFFTRNLVFFRFMIKILVSTSAVLLTEYTYLCPVTFGLILLYSIFFLVVNLRSTIYLNKFENQSFTVFQVFTILVLVSQLVFWGLDFVSLNYAAPVRFWYSWVLIFLFALLVPFLLKTAVQTYLYREKFKIDLLQSNQQNVELAQIAVSQKSKKQQSL